MRKTFLPFALAALFAGLCAAFLPAQDLAVTKGPFQLLQVIENHKVSGPLDDGKVRRLMFPDLAWGAKGYQPRYSAVMVTEVPDAQVGDLLDIRCVVTVMQRPFTDFRTGKPGSAFCPSIVCVLDAAPGDDWTAPPALDLWPGSGEDITPQRVYYQPQRVTTHRVVKTPVFVAYVLGPASAGARKGQYLSIPTSSSYNLTTILHYRLTAAPPQDDPPGP